MAGLFWASASAGPSAAHSGFHRTAVKRLNAGRRTSRLGRACWIWVREERLGGVYVGECRAQLLALQHTWQLWLSRPGALPNAQAVSSCTHTVHLTSMLPHTTSEILAGETVWV